MEDQDEFEITIVKTMEDQDEFEITIVKTMEDQDEFWNNFGEDHIRPT